MAPERHQGLRDSSDVSVEEVKRELVRAEAPPDDSYECLAPQAGDEVDNLVDQ